MARYRRAGRTYNFETVSDVDMTGVDVMTLEAADIFANLFNIVNRDNQLIATVTSAYRTPEHQRDIMRSMLASDEAQFCKIYSTTYKSLKDAAGKVKPEQITAETAAAMPHPTGRAVDFRIGSNKIDELIKEVNSQWLERVPGKLELIVSETYKDKYGRTVRCHHIQIPSDWKTPTVTAPQKPIRPDEQKELIKVATRALKRL